MSRQRNKHPHVVQVNKGRIEFRKLIAKRGHKTKLRCRRCFRLYKELED